MGIDVGGTFIDIVVIDGASGRVQADKVLSTPADLSIGILDGLRKVLGERLAPAVAAARIVHATTTA
ncbi:MAG: hypothetical protein EXQ96_04985, partial [Alphaproteobacteria bacterium]|nr:hypothetical protein [Alphaproteobacteria bacterium]